MSYSILSIDKSMAKEFVFTTGLSGSSIIPHHVKPEKHDTHPDRVDSIKSEDLKHFFEEVASKLTEVESILLAGPGMTKTQFKNHLQSHHSALAKRIVGEITTDHPSDAELIALGKKYFQTHKSKH